MREFFQRDETNDLEAFKLAEKSNEAMNKLSQDPQTSHPFYWGPFVIVGLIDNLKINS